MALYGDQPADGDLPAGRPRPFGGAHRVAAARHAAADGRAQPVQRPPERPHRLAGAGHRRHGGDRRRHGPAALPPRHAPRCGVWPSASASWALGMAAFSAPNTSAIMGSVRRDQLSQASAFLGTMRTAGQALSVALLGGIAASQLGRARRPPAVHARARRRAAGSRGPWTPTPLGYRYAMFTGAVLALVGAAVSLTRGGTAQAAAAGAAGGPPSGAARAAVRAASDPAGVTLRVRVRSYPAPACGHVTRVRRRRSLLRPDAARGSSHRRPEVTP